MTSVTSLFFGFFLLITVPVYWFLPAKVRSDFLFAASLVFLGTASLKILIIILLLSGFIYLLGRLLYGRAGGKTIFILGLLVPIVILAYYKYTPLLLQTMNMAAGYLHRPSLTVPKILVPVGISFFTFKLLHYLIICYRGEEAPGNFRHFLMYMAFFPIFTSGPIERWPHFAGQQPKFSGSCLTGGIARIITGLLKKKVLADNLIVFSNMLNAPDVSCWGYWLAAYAYALQIYFDFSGYSDIAIGSARLFGYEIMENFNWPYLQRNVSQFWKSWHMTLTGWFTQYIFIPLGGSRGSFLRIALNTLVVMAVTGIWHGASWHFMLWGLYHGAGLIVWRIYGRLIGVRLSPALKDGILLRIASTLITFQFVVLGWVFFATGFRQSLHVAAKMLLLK